PRGRGCAVGLGFAIRIVVRLLSLLRRGRTASRCHERRGAVTTIRGRCCDLWSRRLETVAAGNLGLEPARAPVCRGRNGARAWTTDGVPPAAGDPQAECG